MAKITYPSVTVPAYAGMMSVLRTGLDKLVSYVRVSPSAAADVVAQIKAALAVIYSTKAIVTHGDVVTVSGGTHTLSVVAGAVTAFAVGGTKALVSHGQVLTLDGHTYTLTVVAGVVTAVAYV